MKKFSASVPRKMFWSTDVGGTSVCPECGARLTQEYHSYMMAVRHHGDVQPFAVGNDCGYFCPACPTVVLDHDEFGRFASLAARLPKGDFVVLGLIDLDAIPPDKANVPLGEDDNPIPLVKFTNVSRSEPEPRARPDKTQRNRERRLRKRRK